MPDASQKPLRTYGRVKGRTLRAGRASLVEETLPKLAIDLERPVEPGFGDVWVELGFGGGEHLAAQAEAHPGVLVLGAEPFVNGVASLVRHVAERRLGNVRLHAGDGRELIAALPERSVGRVYVLFPDPWPKSRHHKRRLINADTIAELSRVMRPGAVLRFATDWADYLGWTLERFAASPAFAWTAERADDWRLPPSDHVATRYEQKRL
ncbi:MAG TPA: tRNA (guanosine(46)-N7)-methyltransferase TrmB, partial [Caulobacteraceae bacterium]|nr:tRNA (guanosine(46)-N7)-methyltransferase TrmB [Caulobacteraceae bacterium]